MSATEVCNTLPNLIDKLSNEILETLERKETREKLDNEIEKNKLFSMIWDVEDVLNYIMDIKKSQRTDTYRNEQYFTKIERAQYRLKRLSDMILDSSFFMSEDKYELACAYIEVIRALKDGEPDYWTYMLNRRYLGRYDSRFVRNDDFTVAREHDCLGDIFATKKQKIIAMLGNKSKPLRVLFSTAGASMSILNNYKSLEETEPEDYPKIEAYGIYSEAYGQFQDFERTNYKNVAVGYMDKIICTAAAFDVVDMNYYDDCDYDLVNEDGKKSIETGIKYLERNLRYLKDGGYLLITIPRSCISKKFISMLANNGDVIMEYGKDEDNIQHVMIMFQRIYSSSDMAGVRYRAYRRMFHDDDHFDAVCNMRDVIMPEQDSLDRFNESEVRKINIFKGDKPDIEMFLNIMSNSNAFDPRSEEFVVKPMPLLPLTKGQVGQILVSGNLNGVIDEGNGYKHIIKGSVAADRMSLPVEYAPMTDVEEYRGTGYYTRKTVEYRSNTVHVTILTADGEVKYL